MAVEIKYVGTLKAFRSNKLLKVTINYNGN